MASRSVILSPPAVAGLALFALVLGAIFGLRATSNGPDAETEVAGTVVERPEPTQAEEPAETPDVDEPVVVPAPDNENDNADNADDAPADDDDAPAAPAPAPAAEQPAAQPAPEPTVGLIREEPAPQPDGDADPAPADGDNNDGNDNNEGETGGNGNGGNGGNNNGGPRPDPNEPDQTEAPAPEPTEDDRALHEGEGHSRDTALADNGEWLFQEVTGHGDGGGDSLEPQARLTVGFNDAAKQGEGPIRSLQCQAWLTAGDDRLTTDEDHVFEIALLALDDNGVVSGVVTSVLERHAYELEAGETTEGEPMTTTPVEVDAADEVDYTCGVTYRSR